MKGIHVVSLVAGRRSGPMEWRTSNTASVGVMGSKLRIAFIFFKWHQLSRASNAAWVGTIRRRSTRGKKSEPITP